MWHMLCNIMSCNYVCNIYVVTPHHVVISHHVWFISRYHVILYRITFYLMSNHVWNLWCHSKVILYHIICDVPLYNMWHVWCHNKSGLTHVIWCITTCDIWDAQVMMWHIKCAFCHVCSMGCHVISYVKCSLSLPVWYMWC